VEEGIAIISDIIVVIAKLVRLYQLNTFINVFAAFHIKCQSFPAYGVTSNELVV